MTQPGSAATAAVVLTYHPDTVAVENIKRLRTQVPRVYVVNNSPDGATERTLSALAADGGVMILDQTGNVGVAAGFNAGMRAALSDGFDFVWILDQDSSVNEGTLETLVQAHRDAGTRVGVVGPALRSDATGIVYTRERGVGAREVDVMISSGSLFSRELIETIGLHDELLFIDYVDHDICLLARRYGFRNLKVFTALLDHRFGDSDPVRLLGRRVYLSNYSTLRHFHAARNRVIVIRRYGFGRWFWEDIWFTGKAWVKVLLLERDRPAKIGAAVRGLWSGLRYPARRRKW